jgi:hypothetical protein
MTHAGDDTVADSIPLYEVCGISLQSSYLPKSQVEPSKGEKYTPEVAVGSLELYESVSDESSNLVPNIVAKRTRQRSSSPALSDAGGKHEKKPNSLIIKIPTIPFGYNAGRTYHVRATSAEESRNLVEELAHAATAAKRAHEAKSAFEKYQEHARGLFFSTGFQLSAALLIFAVGSPSFAYPAHGLRPATTRHSHVLNNNGGRGFSNVQASPPPYFSWGSYAI